jgi:hypothetical protein
MYGNHNAFFGLVQTELVRYGDDYKHPKGAHKLLGVYNEMFMQITRDYASLPDPRTLKAHEIRFFYNGLREELKQHTKPRN